MAGAPLEGAVRAFSDYSVVLHDGFDVLLDVGHVGLVVKHHLLHVSDRVLDGLGSLSQHRNLTVALLSGLLDARVQLLHSQV
jgi:hypothetical protein